MVNEQKTRTQLVGPTSNGLLTKMSFSFRIDMLLNKKACLCLTILTLLTLGFSCNKVHGRELWFTMWLFVLLQHKRPNNIVTSPIFQKKLKLLGNGPNVSISSLVCNTVLHTEMQTFIRQGQENTNGKNQHRNGKETQIERLESKIFQKRKLRYHVESPIIPWFFRKYVQ